MSDKKTWRRLLDLDWVNQELSALRTSLASISAAGSFDIPSGQTYKINGTAHVHTGLTQAPASLADDSYEGAIISGVAASSLAQWDFVYMTSAGKYAPAKANAATTLPCVGVATASAATNAAVVVLCDGFFNNVGGAALVTGSACFVSSATAGGITTAAIATPNFVQAVGFAVTAKIVAVKPSLLVVAAT